MNSVFGKGDSYGGMSLYVVQYSDRSIKAISFQNLIRKLHYSKPSLIRSQLIRIDKHEKFYSQLIKYFKRHTRFRKADESFNTDDGAGRDGTYITLLPSLPCCSVSLLTPDRTDAIAYNRTGWRPWNSASDRG